jgi:phosphohistidine phosphatase
MRLTLLRHAKTESGRTGQDDWDRQLEPQGKRDALQMAQRFKETYPLPDLIVTSPAVRARATAELFAKQLRIAENTIVSDERLYLASPKVMLQVVQQLGRNASHLLIVGHNPGITEFGDKLSCERSLDNMPTCSWYTLEVDLPDWGALEWGYGMNAELVYPGCS